MAVNSAGVNFGKPNEEFIIESDGSGALVSARNAVTGDEYVSSANTTVEKFEHTFTIKNSYGSTVVVAPILIDGSTQEAPYYKSLSNNNSVTATNAALINGKILFFISSIATGYFTCTNCTAEIKSVTSPMFTYVEVTPTDLTQNVQVVIQTT